MPSPAGPFKYTLACCLAHTLLGTSSVLAARFCKRLASMANQVFCCHAKFLFEDVKKKKKLLVSFTIISAPAGHGKPLFMRHINGHRHGM